MSKVIQNRIRFCKMRLRLHFGFGRFWYARDCLVAQYLLG